MTLVCSLFKGSSPTVILAPPESNHLKIVTEMGVTDLKSLHMGTHLSGPVSQETGSLHRHVELIAWPWTASGHPPRKSIGRRRNSSNPSYCIGNFHSVGESTASVTWHMVQKRFWSFKLNASARGDDACDILGLHDLWIRYPPSSPPHALSSFLILLPASKKFCFGV